MEELFFRFPHLPENIFKFLNPTSSACFMQVWKSSIVDGKRYSPTKVISAFTHYSVSSLKNILQDFGNESLIKLAYDFVEVYSEFQTGTKQTLELSRYTPLHKAAEKGLESVYELIVQDLFNHEGQNKNWYTIWHMNPKDYEEITPLHLAAKNGHLSVCELIMEMIKKYPGNYDLNDLKEDENHDTPLHLASKNGHLEVCQLIISQILKTGGNVNPMNWYGMTPLYLAAKKGHYEVCVLIIKNVTEKNPKIPTSGDTPLHVAALNGHLSVCELFIENVVDKNPYNSIFTTPLHLAAEFGHLQICVLFVQKIADQSPQNLELETPLCLAKKNGHDLVCELFKKL